MGAFYQIADLFVMSSVQEGLGTAVLDAMALGKPIVATHSGGIPEIIHDGEYRAGWWLPADPVAHGQQELSELLTHPERAKRDGKNKVEVGGETKVHH